MYLADKASGFTTTTFRDTKSTPELYDLVNKYAPEVIWSDGDWEAPDTYWDAPSFLSWLATNSSVAQTAVWNDRWGGGSNCVHGSFVTCSDRYQPGSLQSSKWENALTIDEASWGYRRNADYSSYLSTEYFVHQLIETVAFGGNMLLNVGPAADGTIDPIFFDRLLGIGDWLKVNGEAIYSTTPWGVIQTEVSSSSTVYYNRAAATGTLYAIALSWPGESLTLAYPSATASTQVRLVGYGDLSFDTIQDPSTGTGLTIRIPSVGVNQLPCMHAWAFALTNIDNLGASPVKWAD